MKRAINEVFALFKLNYHNQFSAAFPDTETLHHAKRLWLEALAAFSPQEIMAGAKRAILQSEYLPTVHKMLTLCAAGENGLPDARAAYREACNAPSPRANYNWSHPAVYHAGRETGWFFLASNSESIAYPVFAEHYRKLCVRVLEGEKLPVPEQLQLEEKPGKPLSKEENAKKLAELRAELDI
ncbi:replication protein P [Microbulbifer thermotolerans]|uniref:Replication protein P n=1 Tax=Microbulbifer thermotolerans TaxID=252514 RepID=A0AB35HXB7_MICTH|nr:replication protein P [Microbulbifer thermotolerans]MCX2781297.1 replication protein P [Microbulbifer thermotolerans]MCX2784561.1 replication protein P [Microbulbifer thermotolerans]MCX2794439.1 replication protein P [Microbulbifer thermotolerans]MCX2801078.1 replication protein P [Microbulbifer thermotolerans]MCX2804758.1 replication protein P [Microbulbifer thermotolerans]